MYGTIFDCNVLVISIFIMKTNLFFSFLVSIFLLQSCFLYEDDEINVKSCSSIDKTDNNYFEEVPVNTSKKIGFHITNSCLNDLVVENITLKGEHNKVFFIEGLHKGSIISKNGKSFNLVCSPTIKGTKKVTVLIHLDLGEIVMHFNVDAI